MSNIHPFEVFACGSEIPFQDKLAFKPTPIVWGGGGVIKSTFYTLVQLYGLLDYHISLDEYVMERVLNVFILSIVKPLVWCLLYVGLIYSI